METKAAGFWTAPDPAGATVGRPPCDALRDRRTTAGCTPSSGRCGWARRSAEVHEASGGIDPWFLDQIAGLVELRSRDRGRAGARRGAAAPGQAGRAVRPPARRAAPGAGRRGRRAHAAAPARACGRSTRPSTPARPSSPRTTPYHYSTLRRGDRGRAVGPAQGADPRLRAEPDRAGHRVRLLVRARGDGAAGGRLRDRDGQLQPGDRLHRLRHRRPALLRAAHLRGRAGGLARRGLLRPGGRRPGRGRGDRAARRADPARPGPAAQGRRGADRRHLARSRSTWPRTGARSARCWPGPGCAPRRTARPPRTRRPRRSPTRSATRCWSGRRYVLGGRGMEIVYDDATLRDYIGRATDISPEHPVLVDRFLDDAIEIDVDALCDADRRGLPRRRDGAHRGGRHPLRRLGLRAAADHPGRLAPGRGAPLHRGDRPRGRGARACSTCSTRSRTTRSTCWRPTRGRRGPSRSSPRRPRCRWPRRRPGSCSAPPSPSCAPRACCRPTGDGGVLPTGRADRGQGGGAAVQAVPHPGRQGRGHACSARR